ncbi:DUF3106 domain-containing protein [Corticibacter populi]|uniref:DUF3106 domain-containing protein n=1 Tax=Corticibacter populi TaxID=1550736 RepID=A0A3M6QYS6_9BURK|nr:DUF3106 domain-containing protein [Corticibacter populi]RMX07662.1 DUF3106 domain-containing protein [Corticibacter populi]RZS30167.1 uncharacterized protein DUF3106 [Corticibacter populi]
MADSSSHHSFNEPSRPPLAGVAVAAVLLAALLGVWNQKQRPLLSPTLPPGLVYDGPLTLSGHPLPPLVPAAASAAGQPATSSPQTRGIHITRPIWRDLSDQQQTVLAGLEPVWPYISNAEKRRWLAIARQARSMEPEQQQQLIANIADWSHLSEAQRMQIRQQYRQYEATQADSDAGDAVLIQQAWLDFSALDEAERRQWARKAAGITTAKKRPATRRTALVRIPAASQARPGLSNLPKIPLEPVSFRQVGSAGAPPQAASAITHVEAPSAMPAAPPSGNGSSDGKRVIYWNGIPITPPDPLPPVYAN